MTKKRTSRKRIITLKGEDATRYLMGMREVAKKIRDDLISSMAVPAELLEADPIPKRPMDMAAEDGDETVFIWLQATGKPGERLHPPPCQYPEFLCCCPGSLVHKLRRPKEDK